MFLKTNLGYLSQIVLKSMQLLVRIALYQNSLIFCPFITFGPPKASLGRFQALFQLAECKMLLGAFLNWNSVISSFQFRTNEGIKIVPNVVAILIGQSDVKIDNFWGLGIS